MTGPRLITQFAIDPRRLVAIAECMQHYEVGSPDAEWPNNLISRRAVVYESGVIARAGEVVRHEVDADELTRARGLAEHAERLLAGIEVGMGSCGGPHPWRAFFVAANAGARASTITEALIRERFGGTIFPPASVRVEPIVEHTTFWSEFADYYAGSEASKRDPILACLRAAMRWFVEEAELVDRAFVMIGEPPKLWAVRQEDYPPGTQLTGCVLSRLIVGLTRGGSLTGVLGYTVQP